MKCFKKQEELFAWQVLDHMTAFVNQRIFHTPDGVIKISCTRGYDPSKSMHINYVESKKGDWITEDAFGVHRAYDETMFNRLFDKVE